MIDIAYAMGQAPQGEAGAAGGAIGGLLPLILIFAVFYLLLIRPQKKQMVRHKEMINSLKKSDEVVTSGGIHGRVTALRGKEIEVEIAPEVRVTVSRQSISAVKSPEGEQPQK